MVFPVLPPRTSLPSRVRRTMKLQQKERRRLARNNEEESHAATRESGILKMERPKRQHQIWKDRSGVRCAKRYEAAVSLAPMLNDEWVSPTYAERRNAVTIAAAGTTACADPNEDTSEWGDTITPRHTVAQVAESASA